MAPHQHTNPVIYGQNADYTQYSCMAAGDGRQVVGQHAHRQELSGLGLHARPRLRAHPARPLCPAGPLPAGMRPWVEPLSCTKPGHATSV